MLGILAYTNQEFGSDARRRYEALITAGLQDIAAQPDRPESIGVSVLGSDTRSYHLRHSRARARIAAGIVRQPRHFLLYRWHPPGPVVVGRILHDQMDIKRHPFGTFDDDQ